MKVLGTTTNLCGTVARNARKICTRNTNNQYRIICGCKSITDANRQCKAAGLNEKTFMWSYTSETFNEDELRIAGNGGIFIKCDKKYIPIEELKETNEWE